MLSPDERKQVLECPYLVHYSPRENRGSIKELGLRAAVGKTYRFIYMQRHPEDKLKPCVFLSMPRLRHYRSPGMDRWQVHPMDIDINLLDLDLETVGHESRARWYRYYGNIEPGLLSRQ